jgi:exodeoxyribonuclease VII small subunit
MGFSDDMDKLQAIIEGFESETPGIEDALALFEEGVRLIRSCREYLDGAKRKVTALTEEREAGDLADAGE